MTQIIKHELDKEKQGYSAVYQTHQTIQLDEMFGLTGEPVDERKMNELEVPSLLIGRTEQEIVMPYFAWLAGEAGRFLGLPLKEVEGTTKGRISEGYLLDSVQEGYLEQFVHEGIEVVAPTTKYRPMFRSQEQKQE